MPLEKVSGQSVDCLKSYERSVFKALEKLLTEKFRLKPPVPKLEAMHEASCCDVRLALPALKVAVEVGLKGDLFEGPGKLGRMLVGAGRRRANWIMGQSLETSLPALTRSWRMQTKDGST